MDFDKEAKELMTTWCSDVCQIRDERSCLCFSKLEKFARRAFIAGQVDMRERAAVMIDAPSYVGDGRLSEYGHSCRRIANQVRALPTLESGKESK